MTTLDAFRNLTCHTRSVDIRRRELVTEGLEVFRPTIRFEEDPDRCPHPVPWKWYQPNARLAALSYLDGMLGFYDLVVISRAHSTFSSVTTVMYGIKHYPEDTYYCMVMHVEYVQGY